MSQLPVFTNTYPFMEWSDPVPGATIENKVERGLGEFKKHHDGQIPDLILVSVNELSAETTFQGITVRPDKLVLDGDVWLKIVNPEEALQENNFI